MNRHFTSRGHYAQPCALMAAGRAYMGLLAPKTLKKRLASQSAKRFWHRSHVLFAQIWGPVPLISFRGMIPKPLTHGMSA